MSWIFKPAAQDKRFIGEFTLISMRVGYVASYCYCLCATRKMLSTFNQHPATESPFQLSHGRYTQSAHVSLYNHYSKTELYISTTALTLPCRTSVLTQYLLIAICNRWHAHFVLLHSLLQCRMLTYLHPIV